MRNCHPAGRTSPSGSYRPGRWSGRKSRNSCCHSRQKGVRRLSANPWQSGSPIPCSDGTVSGPNSVGRGGDCHHDSNSRHTVPHQRRHRRPRWHTWAQLTQLPNRRHSRMQPRSYGERARQPPKGGLLRWLIRLLVLYAWQSAYIPATMVNVAESFDPATAALPSVVFCSPFIEIRTLIVPPVASPVNPLTDQCPPPLSARLLQVAPLSL